MAVDGQARRPSPRPRSSTHFHVDCGRALSIETDPKIDLVGPTDVMVQVHAASINPLDWKLLSGYGRGTPLELQFPAILGRDALGEVVEVGNEVTTLRPGDRVLGFAAKTFAERMVAPETA